LVLFSELTLQTNKKDIKYLFYIYLKIFCILNVDEEFKPTQNISVNYRSIIELVIKKYFPNIDFNLTGKLEWYPVTEKEKKRNLEKNGRRISKQRVRYFKTQDFQYKSNSKPLDFRQLLISEIEKDGGFYCMYDFKSYGNMGQKTRYKFQIKDFQSIDSSSKFNIELLDEDVIMIR